MENKILFTDLDGTLLRDGTKDISPEMKACLEELLSIGHKIVFSSGRPLNSILEVIESLGLPDSSGVYISAFNGALLYDCRNKRSLSEHRLSIDSVAYMLKQADAQGIHCHTYSDTHIIASADSPELQYYCRHIHLPVLYSYPVTAALTSEPFKLIAIHLTDKKALVDFQQSLLPWSLGHVATLFSNNRYLELFSAKAGKGNALTTLCNLLDIPLANAMASGDAENDLSMIEAAGFGVAMLNASPTIKESADFITSFTNNQDGLLLPLRQFFQL